MDWNQQLRVFMKGITNRFKLNQQLTTSILIFSDEEFRASSDLRKGSTEGSLSRPQLTRRRTATLLSKADRFRAFSISGQYLNK